MTKPATAELESASDSNVDVSEDLSSPPVDSTSKSNSDYQQTVSRSLLPSEQFINAQSPAQVDAEGINFGPVAERKQEDTAPKERAADAGALPAPEAVRVKPFVDAALPHFTAESFTAKNQEAIADAMNKALKSDPPIHPTSFVHYLSEALEKKGNSIYSWTSGQSGLNLALQSKREGTYGDVRQYVPASQNVLKFSQPDGFGTKVIPAGTEPIPKSWNKPYSYGESKASGF